MAKKVLIISTSLRHESNSERLADAFAEGATAAGHKVEKISLRNKKIAFCRGCMSCAETKRCAIADDAVEIAEQMRRADVIAWATPIYYYEMSGQRKTLIDRANSLYSSDYAFRDIYLLATAAEDEPTTTAGALKGLQGWIDCYDKARLAGCIFAGGVNEQGEILGHPSLDEAYETARNIK